LSKPKGGIDSKFAKNNFEAAANTFFLELKQFLCDDANNLIPGSAKFLSHAFV
jgi:hypothetical protein